MFKYFKGDLLIFTKRGLIRVDNIKNTDLILALNKDGVLYYEEIDEIEKVYKKKYTLNKINFINNIDSYFINDNIEIKAIQNIPLNVDTKDLPDYLYYNDTKCCCNAKVGEISSFDYIGFPTTIHKDNYSTKDDNYYRYKGLLLAIGNISTYIFNNEKNNETIDFIIAYLKDNNIYYDLIDDSRNTKIYINNNDPKESDEINRQIKLDEIFNITKEQLKVLAGGLTELGNYLTINNKQDYYIIKYLCLLLGVSISSYYKDGFIQIKISKTLSKINFNYFNHNDLVWNKIKSIKKINNFNGNLFSLKLKTTNYYLTDIGFIS
jgi:hypothetical protein